MGADGVFPAEMPEHGLFLLDDDTAERLVAGRVGPDDAPPGYAGVASVVQAAAGPAEPEELAGREAALAIFRAHGPAGERGRAGSRVPAGARGGTGRGRAGRRALARVVALALAGVMAAGGLWMAGGARTVPGLRFPTGGAGAGGAGSGTPGLVTQARPLTPPVTGAGANARAPVPFSSHERSTRPGGGTASRATPHGSKDHRPGKPPKPKPKKPKPAKPKPEQPKPGGTPKHQR